MLRLYLTVICTVLTCARSEAQDANYWSSSYGPGGYLTPGAVVANNGDSGVAFYNPALLAFTHKNSVSISGNIYQYESVKIKNGAGTGLDLTSTGGSVIPEIASNTLFLRRRKPFTLSYGLIHTPVINYQVTQRKDALMNVLSDSYSPGSENYVGEYSAQNNTNETAGFFSFGCKAGSRWAFGVTALGQIHKQLYSETLSGQALENVSTDTAYPPLVSTRQSYQVSYANYGVRFKGGMAYEVTQRQHLGFLLTSPLVRVGGTGTLSCDNEINNLRISGLDEVYVLASTRQTKLPAKWKMPLSLALGYTIDFDKGQVYVSAEYFQRVKEYNILTPRNDYFLRPDTASNSITSSLLKLKDARRALVNFALGGRYDFSQMVSGFLSLRTDFTYADSSLYKDDDGFTPNTSSWNQYHAELGANIRQRKFNLRTGLLFTYGSTGKYMQPVNFDDPNENNLLFGDPHETKGTHFSAGFMLTYVHNL